MGKTRTTHVCEDLAVSANVARWASWLIKRECVGVVAAKSPTSPT